MEPTIGEESPVSVTLLLFAKARELVGKQEDTLIVPHRTTTVSKLRELLAEKYPQLECLQNRFILSHNQTYLSDHEDVVVLSAGDEIAVIPPISGG